jgi:signal transduction histidine kinase
MTSSAHRKRDILGEIIRVSHSTLEIDARLTKILGILAKAFSPDFCGLYSFHEDKNSFTLTASSGLDDIKPDSPSPYRWENLLREVSQSRQPSFFEGDDQLDVDLRRRIPKVIGPFSLALIPIADNGSFFGVLLLYYARPRTFGDGEGELLLIVGREISGTLRNAQLFSEAIARLDATRLAEEKDRQANQLSLLYEINNALLSTMKFEQILHIVLTAITIGDGMGFNRAILFLTDEGRNCLTGMMGVGPDNAEEARNIWEYLKGKRGNLAQNLASLSRNYSPKGTHLDERVRKIEIPLDKGECILTRTVREQKPFSIDSEGDSLTCKGDCELHSEVNCVLEPESRGDIRPYRFATVPLWGRERAIGVIAVDNIYSGRPITGEDIKLLTMFTRQAGLAIENCILYKYLEDAHRELKKAQETLLQREKLAALGEMAANVAHEIRNPLVSIGAFTRRLYQKLDNGLYEKRYADAIIKEVDRLEGILNDVLSFSKASKVVFEKFDLNRIMEETLMAMEDELRSQGIEVEKSLDSNLPEIPCDYQQVKQVFINLLSNAKDAMGSGGKLTVRSLLLSHEGRDYIGIELRDTGRGIPSEVLHNIFNPFFTTKGEGTGLGLAICHRIVDGHHGLIEVANNPGRGATFTVKLPVQRKGANEEDSGG